MKPLEQPANYVVLLVAIWAASTNKFGGTRLGANGNFNFARVPHSRMANSITETFLGHFKFTSLFSSSLAPCSARIGDFNCNQLATTAEAQEDEDEDEQELTRRRPLLEGSGA